MRTQLIQTVSDFRAACERARRDGGRLSLVPTMGALHRGHLELMREARRRADVAAATIFVNPTQFAPGEDFERYPRDLERDLAQCEQAGIDLVLAPPASELYPRGDRTRVRVSGRTEHLCGRSRPGHFEGVTTIVTKLLAIAGPCTAVFGRKDYQQLKVIELMVRDLLLPVEVVGMPTVREADGLALSSRNAYLDEPQRTSALAIPRALSRAVRTFEAGARGAGELRADVRGQLTAAGLSVDYVELADADELAPFADDARLPERALLAVAAFAGTTRLIDNVVFSEDAAPVAENG